MIESDGFCCMQHMYHLTDFRPPSQELHATYTIMLRIAKYVLKNNNNNTFAVRNMRVDSSFKKRVEEFESSGG